MSRDLHQLVAAKLKRPGDKHRYPDFWPDKEVRAAVINLHRQVGIDAARVLLTERFGTDRTPCKSVICRVWKRLDELRYRHVRTAQAPDQRESADFHALVAAKLKRPGDGHRYPDFWADIDIRTALVDLHREMTLDQVRSVIVQQFGEARAPSLSAIHRFWQRLDELRYEQAGRRS